MPGFSIRKVVWAVDAFEPNRAFFRGSSRFLRAFVEKTGASVEPVFVLSMVPMRSTLAESALQEVLFRSEGLGFLPARLIESHVLSNSDAARRLAAYAQEGGADLIVVCTHARKGLTRFLLGSFAESLLFEASIPVVVFRSRLRHLPSFERLLFPTDFALGSHTVFRKAVAFAKAWGSEVILFHAVSDPIESLFQSGISLIGGTWIPVHTYFRREFERQIRRARAWARWAKKFGVSVEPLMWFRGGLVSENAVKIARRKKASFVAIESRVGSIAQTIRESPCPVLVLCNESERRRRETLLEADSRRAA